MECNFVCFHYVRLQMSCAMRIHVPLVQAVYLWRTEDHAVVVLRLVQWTSHPFVARMASPTSMSASSDNLPAIITIIRIPSGFGILVHVVRKALIWSLLF